VSLLRDVLALAGVGLVLTGLWLVYRPLALVVAGGALLLLALVVLKPAHRPEGGLPR
jgi:hypothetical protein